MRFKQLHRWNLTPTEAIALQRELAGQVEMRTPLAECKLIAGADVSYQRFSNTLYAGVVVLRADDLSVVEEQGIVAETTFPYIPGLLSFREAPALLKVFAKLRCIPDVVLYDGQGIAHPRRMGIASHIGLWLYIPVIGCAKSLLVGGHRTLGKKRGSVAPLKDKGETIGMAVRTKLGCKPVFVSPGHRIDQASAVRCVLQSFNGYRLPEPTRQAHLFVNRLRVST